MEELLRLEPIINKTNKKYAYVVILFGGDGYLPGALTAGYCLKSFGDDKVADIILLHTNDVPNHARKMLSYYYNHVIEVPYIECNGAIHDVILGDTKKQHYRKVWTKFHLFRLVQYEKICLVDADYLPYKSMLELFELSTPAGVSEVPTGINADGTPIIHSDERYNPEWEKIFKQCCSHGKTIPGIILLIFLYSNNLPTGTPKDGPSGNMYYGGVNASVMVLQPSIYEFRSIVEDLYTYGKNDQNRLKFFYPEQQYLTLRYAFGETLYNTKVLNIIDDFVHFMESNFIEYYNKLSKFINIFDKKILGFVKKNIASDNKLLKEKIEYKITTLNVINIINNVLRIYLESDGAKINSNIGPWKSIGLEYYITEYYKKKPNIKIGYPMLMQTKAWNKNQMENLSNGKKVTNLSDGFDEWYEMFEKMIDNINMEQFKALSDKGEFNMYVLQKLVDWRELIQLYKKYKSIIPQIGGKIYKLDDNLLL